MSNFNNTNDEVVECPLCMEPLEVDDLNFFPCTCGYQICRFCWHRIRTDENELCPACRKEYPENPADFTPLTQEEMLAFKSQKRQRDQQRKQKVTENRKHLANVRVVQKNLVFVVGLPPRLADADILKKHEYFGKYGKIHKVVINPSTTYAGVQGPSASAYVTYINNSDSLRAIQSVNNIMIDGRLVKTSLGTTKYCSHFMKNQQCPKGDCMYLHELGDPEASFTKEEMHHGKHQEYEKRLHDALLASSATNSQTLSTATAAGATVNSTFSKHNEKILNYDICTSGSAMTLPLSSTSGIDVTSNSASQQNEVWPSLLGSPTGNKESAPSTNLVGKNKKEKSREKTKNEKITKLKNHKSKIGSNNPITNFHQNNTSTINKENNSNIQPTPITGIEMKINLDPKVQSSIVRVSGSKNKTEKSKEKTRHNKDTKLLQQQEKKYNELSNTKNVNRISNFDNENIKENTEIKRDEKRSLSSSSNVSSSSSMCNNSDNISTISDCASGKSSPAVFNSNSSSGKKCNLNGEEFVNRTEFENSGIKSYNDKSTSHSPSLHVICSNGGSNISTIESPMTLCNENSTNISSNVLNDGEKCISDYSNPTSVIYNPDNNLQPSATLFEDNIVNATAATFSKMNLLGENNSFFTATPFQHPLMQKAMIYQNNVNTNTPHLPDLLNGIDGNQTNSKSNDWDEALRSMKLLNNKQMEDQMQQHLYDQQKIYHPQSPIAEELNRLQGIQNRNNLPKNIGLAQISSQVKDPGSIQHNFQSVPEVNRISKSMIQQQTAAHSTDSLNESLFGTNMLKFFDFHKNQQQLQLNQQYMHNTLHPSGVINNQHTPEHLVSSINTQFVDLSSAGSNLSPLQKQQIENQRLLNGFEILTQNQQKNMHRQQSQHNLGHFPQNHSVEDDLGFDPFIETQKGLAELMEDEISQQNATNSIKNNTSLSSNILQHNNQPLVANQQQLLDHIQRARMPPPGFNHVNTFGFGGNRVLPPNTNKVSPLTNICQTTIGNGAQIAQQPPSTSWNQHLLNMQQHQKIQPFGEMQQIHQNHNNAYNGNDWTSMDPAILSFRQFSFSQPPLRPFHSQQQELYMHVSQQIPNNSGLTVQPQLGGPNISNSQPSTQVQVNANVQGMLEFLKTRQYL